MARSHVSTFRFNDWTADKDRWFSVSTFYREIAKNSRHLLEKYPKLTSHLAISSDFETGGATHHRLTYPTQIFVRDKNTLTRGEREIIEGIHRNRAEVSLGKSEAQSLGHLDDRRHVTPCNERRRSVLTTENMFVKSIMHQDHTKAYTDPTSPACQATRHRNSPSLHSTKHQDTPGLTLEHRCKYSIDDPDSWTGHPWQREHQVAKETSKPTEKDLNQESLIEDVILAVNSKLGHVHNRAKPELQSLLKAANDNVCKLQPNTRNVSTVPPVLTTCISNGSSALNMRSEKTDHLHVKINKQERERKQTEPLFKLVKRCNNHDPSTVNLNVHKISNDDAIRQQVYNSNKQESPSKNKTIKVYLPTAEPELAEDEGVLKAGSTGPVVLTKESPLSHDEFENCLSKRQPVIPILSVIKTKHKHVGRGGEA